MVIYYKSQQMFNSQQNRKIMWDLMVDNNMFTDINPQHFDNIKREFEVKMNKLALLPLSVVALNKQCLTEMLEDVSKYKTAVTAADLQQQRDATFNQGLQSKQNEFKALNTRPTPAKIDFTDKEEDKPIGSEMDAMLAKTIAWREKELKLVMGQQDIQAASKWINPTQQQSSQLRTGGSVPGTGGSVPVPATLIMSSDNASEVVIPHIKLLKIGEDITEPLKKHVTFESDNPLSDTSFLSALKSKPNPTTDLLQYLSDISRKQDEILSLLKLR